MLEVKPDKTATHYVEEIIKRRRSTRYFMDEPVPYETLIKLVEASVHAPSGTNTQCQRFLIISDPSDIARLDSVRFSWPYKSSAIRNKQGDRKGIIANAAALILVFSDSTPNLRPMTGEYFIWRLLDIQDCSAAIENILIMATAMGLGTCWVSASEAMNHTRLLSKRTWREALADYAIPPEYNIQGVILIGHAKTKDPDGFPVGERMHGWDWSPTARRPVENYLIDRRSLPAPDTLPWLEKQKLRILRKLVHMLLAVIKRLDKLLSETELRTIDRWQQKRSR
jgi:nitroreductase